MSPFVAGKHALEQAVGMSSMGKDGSLREKRGLGTSGI